MDREVALKLIQNEALWAKIVAANTIYASLAGSPQEKLARSLSQLSGERAELQSLIAQLQGAVESASMVNVGTHAGGALWGVSLSCVPSNEFILFQGPYELLGLCSDEELARLSLYLGTALYAKEIAVIVLKKEKAKLLAAIGQDSYRFVMDYARYARGALDYVAGGEVNILASGDSDGQHYQQQHNQQQQDLLPLDLSGESEELCGFFMQQGRALLLQLVHQFTDLYLKELVIIRLDMLAESVLSLLSTKERQEEVLDHQRQRQLTLSCARIYSLCLVVLKRGDAQWTQCLF